MGGFKALCDFDWSWPSRCDRGAIKELMTLGFMKDAASVVLIGPNGMGKSKLEKNVAHQALVHGHTVLFTTAGNMLGEPAAFDSDSTRRRRLRRTIVTTNRPFVEWHEVFRCSPTPPVSCRSSIIACITPRSSRSKANRIASRKRVNGPTNAPFSAVPANLQREVGGREIPAATFRSNVRLNKLHRPRGMDARTSARRV
ncbi:ATP-binding protein [Paraburkholderia humisilvae]|uniref:ATP-binding protein n=1 Tax=Paraburkholderia humisilvae TaxID=627669 RepID=UPI0035E4ECE4